MESKLYNYQSKDKEIKIKIQTLENLYNIIINQSKSIEDLKYKIKEILNVSIENQKLIYQGRVLSNSDSILSSRISESSVVHLLIKSNNENNQNQNDSLNVIEQSLNNNQFSLINDNIRTGVVGIPIIRSRRRRRSNMSFDISESFEVIYQNMITINNLLYSRNSYHESDSFINKSIYPYDKNKIKYEKGQWLDAQDSIDQWLEAQVIQVNNEKSEVYIHYNGWGARWDEWLNFSSPRLAPFKTYSINTNPGCYSSPYPSIVPDVHIDNLQRSIDPYFYLEKASQYMTELQKTIDNILKCKKKKNFSSDIITKLKEDKEKTGTIFQKYPNTQSQSYDFINKLDYEILHLTSQIVPIMDRVGRFISDISLHLSHLILDSQYPKLLLGYNTNIDDSLSCTSGYSIYTNDGSNFGISGNINNNLQNIKTSNEVIKDYPNSQIKESINIEKETKSKLPLINLNMTAIQHSNLTRNAYTDSNVDLYIHTLYAPRSIFHQNIQTESNIVENQTEIEDPNLNIEMRNMNLSINTDQVNNNNTNTNQINNSIEQNDIQRKDDNQSISSEQSNTHSVCSLIRRNLEPSSSDRQIKLSNNDIKDKDIYDESALIKNIKNSKSITMSVLEGENEDENDDSFEKK